MVGLLISYILWCYLIAARFKHIFILALLMLLQLGELTSHRNAFYSCSTCRRWRERLQWRCQRRCQRRGCRVRETCWVICHRDQCNSRSSTTGTLDHGHVYTLDMYIRSRCVLVLITVRLKPQDFLRWYFIETVIYFMCIHIVISKPKVVCWYKICENRFLWTFS